MIYVEKNAPDIEEELRQKATPTFAGLDVSSLEEFAHQPVDWLVSDVFGADQPTVFGARSKAGKTSQLCDLSIALATQTNWLGHFDVPKQRRVLFITGESNNRAISKRLRRAAESRNSSLRKLGGWLRVEAINFPKLPITLHCEAIARTIEQWGIEVVILDPLYRGLTSDMDTNKMAAVGEAIVQFARACQPASLILSHHTTKSAAREYGQPPELEDMTGAGIAESCGNWWLLGRNKKYEWNWQHDLCVQYGGRDEQAGAKRIQFDEENWKFEVESFRDYLDDSKAEQKAQREAEKARANQQRLLQARAQIKAALANQPRPISRTALLEQCSGTRTILSTALAEMIHELEITTRSYHDDQRRLQPCGYILQTRVPQYEKQFPEHAGTST